MRTDPAGFEAVDDAIQAGAEDAFAFLERLVGARSTVGEEAPAQRIVAGELARLGFDVAAIAVPPQTAADASAGVPQASYAGRDNVLGRLGRGGSPSLLLNGHVDVVPAEAGRLEQHGRVAEYPRVAGRQRPVAGALLLDDRQEAQLTRYGAWHGAA